MNITPMKPAPFQCPECKKILKETDFIKRSKKDNWTFFCLSCSNIEDAPIYKIDSGMGGVFHVKILEELHDKKCKVIIVNAGGDYQGKIYIVRKSSIIPLTKGKINEHHS